MAEEQKNADAVAVKTVAEDGNLSTGDMIGELVRLGSSESGDQQQEVSDEGDESGEEQAAAQDEETESDSEESSHDEDDEVLSQLSPHAAERARKRIDKLTARAKGAEEALEALKQEHSQQVSQLEERLQSLESGKEEVDSTGMSFDNRVEKAKSPEDIRQLIQIAEATRDWADEKADELGYDETIEVDGQTYTRQQLRAMKRAAQKAIEKTIPKRVNDLRTMEAVTQQVYQAYPAWQDKSHPEHKVLLNYEKTLGEAGITGPYLKVLASRLVDADKWLQSQQKQGTKKEKAEAKEQEQVGKRARDVPPSVPVTDDAPAPSPGDKSGVSFPTDGPITTEQMVAFFASKERAKRNQKG